MTGSGASILVKVKEDGENSWTYRVNSAVSFHFFSTQIPCEFLPAA